MLTWFDWTACYRMNAALLVYVMLIVCCKLLYGFIRKESIVYLTWSMKKFLTRFMTTRYYIPVVLISFICSCLFLEIISSYIVPEELLSYGASSWGFCKCARGGWKSWENGAFCELPHHSPYTAVGLSFFSQ